MRLSLVAILICSMAFATTGDNSETCAENDGSCPVKKRSVVYTDYAPGTDSEEHAQEDVDDADMVMHMQMRLNIEVPVESPEAASASAPQHQASHVVHTNAVATGGAKLPETREILVDVPESLLAAARMRSMPEGTAPASFYSGSQLLLGAGIGALLVVVGLGLAVGLHYGLAKRNKSKAELRAAGKAWMLDWALGFEPEKDEDEEAMVNSAESQLKLYPKKKQPPMATASDSGHSTDEEEPEAESEDQEATAEMLEDAVYVAEQVEEANQAVDDRGYGFDLHQSQADQIQHDLR